MALEWTELSNTTLARVRKLDFLPPDFIDYITKNFTIRAIEGRTILVNLRKSGDWGVAYHAIFTVTDRRFPKTVSKLEVFSKPSRSQVDSVHLKIEKLVEKEKNCAKVPLFLAHYKDRAVMQFYSSKVTSLSDFLCMKGISGGELKTIGAQLGKFFALIHNNGIIHHDSTFTNFLVSGRARHIVVYVIDFDLSEVTDARTTRDFREDEISYLLSSADGVIANTINEKLWGQRLRVFSLAFLKAYNSKSRKKVNIGPL